MSDTLVDKSKLKLKWITPRFARVTLTALAALLVCSPIVDSTINGKLLALQSVFRRSNLSSQQQNRFQEQSAVYPEMNNASSRSNVTDSYAGLMRSMNSGLKNSSELRTEIRTLLQGAEPVDFASVELQRTLQLSMVVFHHQNNDDGLELLAFHSLPQSGLREDVITFFNQKIDIAEEQSIRDAILVSRRIHVQNGKPEFATNEIEQYNFQLRPAEYVPQFTLREPDAAPYFAKDQEGTYITQAQVKFYRTVLGGLIVQTKVEKEDSPTAHSFYFIYEDAGLAITASR